MLGRELQVKGVRTVSQMPGFSDKLKVFQRITGEQWVQAAGHNAERRGVRGTSFPSTAFKKCIITVCGRTAR